MTTKVQRYVLVETVISIVISIAFNVGATFLALQSADPITLLGVPGLAIGFLPGTFMTSLMVVLALTLLTRMRRRKGVAPPADEQRTRLPKHAFVRALTIAVLATAILAPITVGLLYIAYPGPYTLATALGLNAAFGVLLAILISPPVLKIALAEPL